MTVWALAVNSDVPGILSASMIDNRKKSARAASLIDFFFILKRNITERLQSHANKKEFFYNLLRLLPYPATGGMFSGSIKGNEFLILIIYIPAID